MASLKRFLGWGPERATEAPDRVPTDKVMPLHFMDQSEGLASLLMAWQLRFNDVLDADKLHDALTRLLKIGDWRKLGGRLRKGADGKLEMHIPAEFSPERPAVHYIHETFEMLIDEHSLGAQLPRPTEDISLHPSPDHFRPFIKDKGIPEHIDDYLLSDAPVLSLLITSFTDATIVTLSWPHSVTDGLGRHALVSNWCKVLAGRENEVSPLLGVYEDPLDGLGTGPLHPTEIGEPYLMKDKVLKGLGLVVFIVLFFWDIVWRPNHDLRVMCIPPKAVAALRVNAQGDLERHQNDENKGAVAISPSPFISDGDILCAWLTRLTCQGTLSPTSTRPIAFRNTFELRSRLPDVFPESKGVYIGNYVTATTTELTADEARSLPLGLVALRYRQSLSEQTTEAQIRGFLRVHRSSAGASAQTVPANCIMINCSNWTKAKFFEVVDFSPAVVSSGGKKPLLTGGVDWPETPGKPVYHHVMAVKTTPSFLRNVFNILGKDSVGNYWAAVQVAPSAWPRMEEEIRNMNGDWR